jgi:hypothetical protein
MRLILILSALLSFPVFADNSALYTCARDLALVNFKQQALGPIFYQEGIAFTAADISATDHRKMFVVMTRNEVYAVLLNSAAVQRMFFRLNGASWFVGYMHGEILGDRYLEFSRNSVPDGKKASDYSFVELKPAPYMASAMLEAMSRQLDQVLAAISDGSLDKRAAAKFELATCRSLNQTSVAAEVRHKVDVFRVWTAGPTADSPRMPASVSRDF